MDEKLYERTQRLLRDSQEPRRVIALGTGLGKSWIDRFATKEIPNPGIHSVQLLHDYLVSISADEQ